MNKQEAKKIAATFFPSYPKIETFYITTDGQAFEKSTDADAHSKHLDKKNPVFFTIDRNDEEVIEDEKQIAVDTATKKIASLSTKVEKAQAAVDGATGVKKAAAQTKLDTAKTDLEEAQKELAALTPATPTA